MKDFAHRRQIKLTSTVLQPSVPFQTLIKLVNAEDITNGKNRTLDLGIPLESTKVTSILESHSLSTKTFDVNPEIMFTETTD